MIPRHAETHAAQSGSAPWWAQKPAPRSVSSSGSGSTSVESTARKMVRAAYIDRSAGALALEVSLLVAGAALLQRGAQEAGERGREIPERAQLPREPGQRDLGGAVADAGHHRIGHL